MQIPRWEVLFSAARLFAESEHFPPRGEWKNRELIEWLAGIAVN
jgi:hypothetical protein